MNELLNPFFLLITYASIGVGVFVVLLLNNRNTQKSRANLFLSILLIALTFSVAHMLFAGVVLQHLAAQVYSVGDPTFYLIAPLLWLYTNELTGHRVKAEWKLLLHLLPFFLIVSCSSSFHFNLEALRQFLFEQQQLVTILFSMMLVIQFTLYLVLVRQRWMGYQQFVQAEVSNREGVDISWVRFFLTVFLIINMFFMFNLFAAIHFINGPWLQKTTALIFASSIFALGYKGILQKELFHRVDSIPDPIAEPILPDTSKPDQQLLNRLLMYMTEKRPYLDAELTLSSLAKDTGISRSQLSLLINDGTGDNFYDFINKYRVEEVKRLMIDPQAKNYNLLGIALEAGFKSKSTFNLIFKRFTGLTPSEYKKNLSP